MLKFTLNAVEANKKKKETKTAKRKQKQKIKPKTKILLQLFTHTHTSTHTRTHTPGEGVCPSGQQLPTVAATASASASVSCQLADSSRCRDHSQFAVPSSRDALNAKFICHAYNCLTRPNCSSLPLSHSPSLSLSLFSAVLCVHFWAFGNFNEIVAQA